MTTTSDDPSQKDAFPKRAPRKQSLPHRAPSTEDLTPGRVFIIDFGMAGSCNPDEQLHSAFVPPASIACTIASLGTANSPGDRTYTNSHLTPKNFSDQCDIVADGTVRQKPTYSNDKTMPINPPKSPTIKTYSLADQYLDTMVMDDFWRAACVRQIRQNRRKQLALKRGEAIANRQSSEQSSFRPYRKKSQTISPTPPNSPRAQYDHKVSSPHGSDSGFISSSPTPTPPDYLRVRSTRNCPVSDHSATISINISTSMVGRSCLSCGCTTTTCWRRTLGGIICNSCGLRYKKCGIICADAKCRYIPTRSEIREMKGRNIRGGYCYACRGPVFFREDVERHA